MVTLSVRQAGIELNPTFCTDTFSGVFNRCSQLIWIASGKTGPSLFGHTNPTVNCTLGGRRASKQSAFKVYFSLWSVACLNFAIPKRSHSNYYSFSNLESTATIVNRPVKLGVSNDY